MACRLVELEFHAYSFFPGARVAFGGRPFFSGRARLHIQTVQKVGSPTSRVPKSQRKHATTFVPPPPSLLERFKSTRLYKYLYEVEWSRWIRGDFSVPYTTKRIMKLKERDKVPMLTDLIYSYRLEGSLRTAFFFTNLTAVIASIGVIEWYRKSGFKVQYPPVDRHAEKRPLRLDTRLQYATMLGFAALLVLATNICRRRVILRCYYDASTDQFTVLTVDAIGRVRPFNVKSGSAKELKTKGMVTAMLGNIGIVDQNSGKIIRTFFADRDSFLLPWYHNRLMGYHTPDSKDQNPLMRELKGSHFSRGNKQRMVEELSKLNAKKLDEVRDRE